MKRWIATGVLGTAAVLASFRLFDESHAHASHAAVDIQPTSGAPLSIARWQQDSGAAISFTFDDGLQCHRDKAMPLLDAFGFKGTFFVIPGKMREHRSDPPLYEPRFQQYGEAALSWDEVREMQADGQEIGNHSLSHIYLGHLTDESVLEDQINGGSYDIQAHLGEPPLTFAYPYSDSSPLCRQVALEKHLAVREHWSVYGGPGCTLAKLNNLVFQAIANRSWLVPMIHGIDTGYLSISSSLFHDHLAFIQQHLGHLWVDTYANVARYQRERQNASLQLFTAPPGETKFQLVTPLDSEIYNVPLTVIVPLPVGVDESNIEVSAVNKSVECVRQAARLLVTVQPGTGPVTVTWNEGRSHGDKETGQ